MLQQGVASQYSYSAGSYSGQQAGAPASTASAAYGQPQAYAQQGYSQQAYQVGDSFWLMSRLFTYVSLQSFVVHIDF